MVRSGPRRFWSHVLDLRVEPDHTLLRKDEDELVQAVAPGVFDEAAAAIEADCSEVEAVLAACGAPFDEGWEMFRPDPAWPVPSTRLP